MSLGEYIKDQIRKVEQQESQVREDYLCKLPTNVFAAIYWDNYEIFAGTHYNDVYYSELEIYYASLRRDEGYEVLL